MALSVVAIRAAKARNKSYKLSDSDGLYLLVTPSGGRYWRMNYRHLGKQRTLAFGVWPETGLAEARAERDAARKVLARGDDPAERIKLDRIAATVAAASSFTAVADEWLRKVEKEGRSAVTLKKLRWLLGFINAAIGKRPDRCHLGARAADDATEDGSQGPLRDRQAAAQHVLAGLSLCHRHGARRPRRRVGFTWRANRTQACPPRCSHLAEGGGRATSRHQ